jgi:hypothetical protein
MEETAMWRLSYKCISDRVYVCHYDSTAEMLARCEQLANDGWRMGLEWFKIEVGVE